MTHFVRAFLLVMTYSLSLEADVTGRVVDEDNAPIAGARVRGFAREPFEAFYARALSSKPEAVAVGTTETDMDGAYAFATRGHSVVTVVAQAIGKRAGYRVAADGEMARTLILQAGERRCIHVTDGKDPVSGALIVDQFFVARTSNDGYAEIEEPDGGIFESPFVIHPGYAISRADPPRRDSSEVLEIALTRGSPISGRVVTHDGAAPLGNAVVLIDRLPLALTAADGSFTIPHALASWQTLTATDGSAVGIALHGASTSYEIRVGSGASVRGTIRNAITEAPIAGALVWMEHGHAASRRSAVADGEGRFAIGHVPPGQYTIEVGHHAFTSKVTPLLVDAGITLQRDFSMVPLGAVAGIVLDGQGSPVASVAVSFGGRPNVTGADGRFYLRVPRMARGVSLTARKNGYEPGAAGPFAIVEGETKSDIVIFLRPD